MFINSKHNNVINMKEKLGIILKYSTAMLKALILTFAISMIIIAVYFFYEYTKFGSINLSLGAIIKNPVIYANSIIILVFSLAYFIRDAKNSF